MDKYQQKKVTITIIMLFFSSLLLWSYNLTIVGASSTTVSYQIIQGTDDVFKGWNGTDWVWHPDKLDNEVGYYEAENQKEGMGLRFLNINIPQGTHIISAYLSFYYGSGYGIDLTNIEVDAKIWGEASDNASTFSTLIDFDTRLKTSINVTWANVEPFHIGNWYNSPNVGGLIQEIVDRAGWTSGNALALYPNDFDGISTANNKTSRAGYAYERDPLFAPILTITYDAVSSSSWSTTDWPMFQYNLEHTGESDGSVLFVGSNEGIFYAYNLTSGSQIWNYTVALVNGDAGVSSPAVINGTVYFGSRDNNLYALNAATGAKLWSHTTDDFVDSSPTVVNGIVYMAKDSAEIYAVNSTTGISVWNNTDFADVYTDSFIASPVVSNGVVFACSAYNNYVFALNAATGIQIWNFSTSQKVYTTPAVSGGTVYVSDYNGNLYALNATTGTQIWINTDSGGYGYSAPTIANNTVYAADIARRVFAFSTTDGSQIWNHTFPSNNGIFFSSPAIANGLLYIGDTNLNTPFYFYALNQSTGTQVWNWSTPEGRIYSSPAVSNGAVYFGTDGAAVNTTSKTLIALAATNGSLIWDAAIGPVWEASPAIIEVIAPLPQPTATPTAAPQSLPVTINVAPFWQYLYNGNLLGFFQAIFLFSFGLQSLLYGALSMLFFVPLYIKTKSLLLLSVLWILLGGFFITAMPVVSGLAIVFLILGIGGVLWRLVHPTY